MGERAQPQVLAELFEEYRRSGDLEVRNQLVEEHSELAEYFVRRYGRRGVAADDLRQLALMSVIHAVDRFDPEVGVAFSTFASRTIEGELKRHFRDRTWSVRPPRRMQELHLEVRRAEEDMAQRLGRSPTVTEMARELEVGEEDVLQALEAGTAHQAASLDQPAGPEDESTRGERLLGQVDTGFVQVDREMIVRQLLEELPERERTVVYLRFFENLTQPEIAERVGISQSYLSRLLRRTFIQLRDRIDELEA